MIEQLIFRWCWPRPRWAVLAVASLSLLMALAPASAAQRQGAARAQPGDSGSHAAPLPPLGGVASPLARVRSWGYQLKHVDVRAVAASPFDLVVVDYARSAGVGKPEKPFTRSEVEAMRRMPDGGRRIVLAYLSIGEAETYRWYWSKAWENEAQKPEWLGDPNDNWRDNHLVRYWHPDWRRIVFEGADSFLDRILAAGFDGVYLDRADVAFHWRDQKEPGVDPVAEMVAFVSRLSAAAKAKAQTRPGPSTPFYVVAQNAEELCDDARYVEAIDGIAKEDLLFGLAGDEEPNAVSEIGYSTEQLGRVKAAGKAVLVVEYVRSPDLIAEARLRLEPLGFRTYFGPRSLEWLAPEPRAPSRSTPVEERRIALVIANARYQAADALASPANDGPAVAQALRRLGFNDVVERYDIGLKALKAEIKALGIRARSADWAVVFYAGHGFEHDGTNFLAPIDAKLTEDEEADEQALPLPNVLSELGRARKLGLLILDASRELGAGPATAATVDIASRPVADASGGGAAAAAVDGPDATGKRLETGRGLAPIEPPRRVMVVSAVRHGRTTSDQALASSPFVSALLRYIEQPGLEIGTLVRSVRRAASEATKAEQVPQAYVALPAEPFYFRAAAGGAERPAGELRSAPAIAPRRTP